jgi:hypothetical protein
MIARSEITIRHYTFTFKSAFFMHKAWVIIYTEQRFAVLIIARLQQPAIQNI